MRDLKAYFIMALLALSLAGLLVTQQAQCEDSSSSLEIKFTWNLETPITGELEVFDAQTATVVYEATSTDFPDFFSIPLPPGEYRLRINAHKVSDGSVYGCVGFYDGEDSKPQGCFEDSEPVTVTASEITTIGWMVDLEHSGPMLELESPPAVISGLITGSAGDPGTVRVIARTACIGREVKNVEASIGSEGQLKFELRFEKNEWPGPIRLRFVSEKYPPEYYGADGQDIFALGTPISWAEKIDLGEVVIGPKYPDIEVEPTSLTFPDTVLLGSSTLSVTVRNGGYSVLTLNSVALQGENGDISLVNPLSEPLALAPQVDATFFLTFSPSTMDWATSNLAITSDDPDEPAVLVSLTGLGVASTAPPAEQVVETLGVIRDSITTGDLTILGPEPRAQAFLNQIKGAADMAAMGKENQACAQLTNALRRVDGDPSPPDYFEGPDRDVVWQLIENTRVSLGCN